MKEVEKYENCNDHMKALTLYESYLYMRQSDKNNKNKMTDMLFLLNLLTFVLIIYYLTFEFP